MNFTMPEGAAQAVASDIRTHGLRGVETGGFLLAPRNKTAISTIAMAGGTGITRRPGLLIFSMRAIDQLFTQAEDTGLRVVAHVHSHARGAFMSPTDRLGIMRQQGFIAAVVPTFASPPSDPSDWGWWIFDGGDWAGEPPIDTFPGHVERLVFDEDGVR